MRNSTPFGTFAFVTFAAVIFISTSSVKSFECSKGFSPFDNDRPSPSANNLNLSDSMVIRGWKLFYEKKPQEALAELGRALALDPGDSFALEVRGRIFYAMSRNAEALDDFSAAIATNPRNAAAYFHRAQVYIAVKNYLMAQSDLESVIRIEPTDVEAYSLLGEVLSRLGNPDSGKRVWDSALARINKDIEDPSQIGCKGDLLSARGLVHLRSGNLKAGIADMSAAIDLEPKDPQNFYLRAIAYYETHIFEKAIKDLTKAIELNPNWGNHYRARALAYRAIGDRTLAAADEKRYEELSSGSKPN